MPKKNAEDNKELEVQVDSTGAETCAVGAPVPTEAPPIQNDHEEASPSVLQSEVHEEEETWTNKPSHAEGSEPGLVDDDLGADDEEAEEERESQRVTRKPIQNGRDVICEELPDRAARAKLRLKPHLTCLLGVEITSSGERFVFDWKGDEPKVAPVTGALTVNADGGGSATVVESIVSLSEQNLMAVRSGDLNPQVAMLSDKIRVKGRIGPAVYLFNLIAPRFQQ